MSTTLTFHGAAECVTGFCARLETDRAVVLVDCGMFQGPKPLKALNYDPFPFDPEAVDAVLLTHAHIDHSGLLPKLMKAGFTGPIFATETTRELSRVLLVDSGDIQEFEVAQLNRRNQRRGKPTVEPIFTAEDAIRTIDLFRSVELKTPTTVAPGITATFWNAGHILGSTSIEVGVDAQEGPLHLLFSGDLGPGGRELAPDPEGPSGVDHVVLESTYGDRERPPMDAPARRQALAQVLNEAHAAGGPVLLPAFAVERTQELLADLVLLMENGDVPRGEIFLDSPLAIEACEVFLRRGWNPAAGRNPFASVHEGERIRYLEKPAESDSLDRLTGWHLILAGSGMCDAGRVRKHLKRLLWRREATVLLTGFQATGTLGRLLAEGCKNVRIQGDEIQVRARVRMLDVYSGHADAKGLVTWAEARKPIAGSLLLTHGEPDALAGLSARLTAAGVAADRIAVPVLDQSFALTKTRAKPAMPGARRLPPGAATSLDWHNARAEFLGRLQQRLENAPDDAARLELIRALTADL